MKWGWAVVQAQALQADIDAFAADTQIDRIFTSRTEYHAKRHAVLMILESVEPLPARWGLRLGDVANNNRAALDHLAWALVMRGSTPLPEAEWGGIYFPIAVTKQDFDANFVGKGKLRGLRATDRATIRRYQPYVRGERKAPFHCLTPLPQLTRDDKHREIRPVLAAPTRGIVQFSNPRDCEVTRAREKARRVVLEVGAEIHRVYVRKTGPNPDVHMEAQLSAKPTLNGKIWLYDWLAQTSIHIGFLLSEFAERPDEIDSLGIKFPGRQNRPRA